MLRKILLAVLGLLLLAVPLAIRWLYFYEGQYKPGPVPRPDLAQVRVPTAEIAPFVDTQPRSDPGTVLVDLSHANRVEMAELSVLQARLAARGQRLEPVQDFEEGSELADKLRYAKALVVVSPGTTWRLDEIQMVQDFVDKGGRLLLVADPTRFDVVVDEEGAFVGLDSDVIHVNDLAAQFGLVFQSDYLYNTVENEGNFRNIRLTDFADHALTEGLDQLVFYAVHSLVSEEPALISTSGETRSSNRERVEDLAVATLAAEGAVLALGDLTFMTEPYNESYDNDQFVANIADFLSGARRQYDLADFPYFFGDQAHLVFAGDPLVNADLLASGSALQNLFSLAGKELIVREAEDGATDTLFFGLYGNVDEVGRYLAEAQITLSIAETGGEGEAPELVPPLVPTASLAITPAITPVTQITVTPPVYLTPAPAITATTQISPSLEDRLGIEPVGELALDGTLLFILHDDGLRHVMAVLADTDQGLEKAVERLSTGDLKGCLLHRTEAESPTSLALCPTGQIASEDGAGDLAAPWPREPTPSPEATETEPGKPVTDTIVPGEPEGEPQGSILILSLDEGQGRYDSMTGADDYRVILGTRYDVATWSKANDPPLDPSRLLDYDLVIWTAGDFEEGLGDLESELLLLVVLNGTPVIVSGAYVADAEEESVQRDLRVADADHPLAKDFQPEEVVDFVSPPSGEAYEIDLLQETAGDERVTVFVRGGASEDAGASSVWVVEDKSSDMSIVFIGFPIYLLPEAAKSRLVLNAADWLLSP